MTGTVTLLRPSSLVVAIVGDLEDERDLLDARRLLELAQETAHGDPVVIDLSQLGAISSGALRLLRDAVRVAALAGSHLTFTGASPYVARRLVLMDLERSHRHRRLGQRRVRAARCSNG